MVVTTLARVVNSGAVVGAAPEPVQAETVSTVAAATTEYFERVTLRSLRPAAEYVGIVAANAA